MLADQSDARSGVEDEDIDYEVKRVLRHRWNAEFNRRASHNPPTS